MKTKAKKKVYIEAELTTAVNTAYNRGYEQAKHDIGVVNAKIEEAIRRDALSQEGNNFSKKKLAVKDLLQQALVELLS